MKQIIGLLYTSNQQNSAVVANGTVPFGTSVHGFGQDLINSGGSVTLDPASCGCGRNIYVDLDIDLTVLPTAAGAVSATLYANGVAVPGATQTGTAAAAGDAVPLHITGTTMYRGCGANTAYTVQLSAAGTANMAARITEFLNACG